jgi:hypothetical protein
VSDWSSERLGALCEFDPSKSQVRHLASGTIVTFLPVNDLGIGGQTVSGQEKRTISEAYKGYTYFADGDVLLAKIAPCFENGKLGVAANLKNEIGFGSSEFMVLRPGPRISARYLAHYLSQDRFRRLGAKAMTGAVGHKRVPKEWVQDFEIPLPPLAEQQRIVAILDEAFEGIAATELAYRANLARSKTFGQITLRKILESGGDDWEDVNLHEVATVESGAGFPEAFQGSLDESLAFFKVGDMNAPGNEIAIEFPRHTISEETRVRLGARVFPIGSVIFPKVGGAIATNKKRLVARPCCVDNNVMGIIPKVVRHRQASLL